MAELMALFVLGMGGVAVAGAAAGAVIYFYKSIR